MHLHQLCLTILESGIVKTRLGMITLFGTGIVEVNSVARDTHVRRWRCVAGNLNTSLSFKLTDSGCRFILMSCSFTPNTTVTDNLQWWQVSETLAQNRTCGETYLRPDVSGALMPWVFTVLQIMVHIPVIAYRVAKWEDVQTVSIILAAFNVAIACQAYAATQLTTEDVLVWSPMTLVLDGGAMLQQVVLVIEVHPGWWNELLSKFRARRKHGEFPWNIGVSRF